MVLWSPTLSFGLDVSLGPSSGLGRLWFPKMGGGGGYEGISQFGTWGKGCSCLLNWVGGSYFKGWARALGSGRGGDGILHAFGYRSQAPRIQPPVLVPAPPAAAPLVSA